MEQGRGIREARPRWGFGKDGVSSAWSSLASGFQCSIQWGQSSLAHLSLRDQQVLHDQILEVRAVEHVERVGRCADDRLAAAVHGGVEHDTVASAPLEL